MEEACHPDVFWLKRTASQSYDKINRRSQMAQYPSDRQLIAMLGNPAEKSKAFEQMVGKYSSRLYWQIRCVVTFHDDADDVLQNTFIKAWNAIDSFRGDSMLSTWLYRIAANESLAFLRHRAETVSLDSVDANLENMFESDAYFDGDEIQKNLQRAIQTLPPKQRQVFALRYYDNMKYEDMAEVLNTSVGALKASYHIAVKKIEDFFEGAD